MSTDGIHPELNDMIERGQFSETKIAELIRLRHIVDSYAKAPYVTEEEAARLTEKYGAAPDILAWSDYFQTEVGSRYFMVADEEFAKVVDTVRYDLISAVLIFQGKSAAFLQEVEQNGLIARSMDPATWNEAEEEAAHLYILKEYFLNMGLETAIIPQADLDWFNTFVKNENARAAV